MDRASRPQSRRTQDAPPQGLRRAQRRERPHRRTAEIHIGVIFIDRSNAIGTAGIIRAA
jgi:hypothetical protein